MFIDSLNSNFRIELVGSNEIKYSNGWIRGNHMDMKNWKPDQICPYGFSLGDMYDGGTFLFLRMQLVNLKLKVLGIREYINALKT